MTDKREPLEWGHALWVSQQRPRRCPACSSDGGPPVTMTPRLVPVRVAGASEHEVLEGAQLRWTCPACQYGELVQCSGPPKGQV